MGECTPKVSIIIPVYNGSKYLRGAIDSALGQTYPNVEVIVVNDGSTDEGTTERIALSYGDRIRYFAKGNGGVSTALNLAIAQMRGEYFSWLSHDDIYYPQKIEAQINYLLQNQLTETILYGGYELIDQASQVISQVKLDNAYPLVKLNIPLLALLRGLINGCTLLIHKSHFEKSGLFNEDLKLVQDYDLWFKMFRKAQVHFVPGIFVKTRVHKEQQTYSKFELALSEGNMLWKYFIDKVTDQEMRDIDGSPYNFYRNTAMFLKNYTKYTEARNHAENLASKISGKVSVVIPFYNRIGLLLESIRSVLAQTYSNFEIIVIDDGSTEDIRPVMAIQDSRIRYVRQRHQGVSAARNLGISLATGEYIAFLDSDDLFVPEKLEKQVNYMQTHEVFFSHTSYQRMNMNGILREVIHSGNFTGNAFPRILASCGIATPTVMIKREILENLRFDESIDLGEDVCLWIDLAYSYRLGGIDEPLTRVRVGKLTSALNPDKQRIAFRNIYNHIIKSPHYSIYKQEIGVLLKGYYEIENYDWLKYSRKHIHQIK